MYISRVVAKAELGVAMHTPCLDSILLYTTARSQGSWEDTNERDRRRLYLGTSGVVGSVRTRMLQSDCKCRYE